MAAQPPRIITNLAKDLSRILADYLTNPELDNKRIPLNDRLAIKLMLTLDKQVYRRELLFRDYSQTSYVDCYLPDGRKKKVCTESMNYLSDVLTKHLTIVSKHKSLPTNLHLLLLMFFRYSKNESWLRTRIKRQHKPPMINDLYFKKTANVLKRQCDQLQEMGKVSKTYRKKYGCFHLMSGNSSAELVEEISLFDTVEAAPLPLRNNFTESPAWYVPLLERILVSLNESYGLLRSCGLPPNQWQSKLSDGQLSIGKLRALKQLKKMSDNCLKVGDEKDTHSAYQRAFLSLSIDKAKLAGFESFEAFTHSEIGNALLKVDLFSLDEEEREQYLLDSTSLNEGVSVEINDALKKLLIDHLESFTPVTAYFFEQVIILGGAIDKALKTPKFLKLLSAEEKYADLTDEALKEKLTKMTEKTIKKHLDFNSLTA